MVLNSFNIDQSSLKKILALKEVRLFGFNQIEEKKKEIQGLINKGKVSAISVQEYQILLDTEELINNIQLVNFYNPVSKQSLKIYVHNQDLEKAGIPLIDHVKEVKKRDLKKFLKKDDIEHEHKEMAVRELEHRKHNKKIKGLEKDMKKLKKKL